MFPAPSRFPDAGSAARAAPTPAPIASPASILALTEDPEARDLLLEPALAEGFGVRCAQTEVEAVEILRLEQPGLVLVDLDLSTRAGPRFMRDLRQGPLRALPRMAITASNDPMLAVRVDAPVFFKPDLDGIDAAIERLFRPR